MTKNIVPVAGSDTPLSVGDEIEVPSGTWKYATAVVLSIDYAAEQATILADIFGVKIEDTIPIHPQKVNDE